MNGSLSFCGDCLPKPESIVESEILSDTVNTFNQRPHRRLLTGLTSPRLASSFISISLKGLVFGHLVAFLCYEHFIVFARSPAARPSSFCCRCCL